MSESREVIDTLVNAHADLLELDRGYKIKNHDFGELLRQAIYILEECICAAEDE